MLLPLKTGGRPAHQLLHPTHRITDPPCLPPPPHPTPTSLLPRSGQSGPNFPAPSMSPFPKAEVPLPFRRQVWGGVGSCSPLQRLSSRYTGGRGVRRRRGPGDRPPPPPRSPSKPPSPSSATRGGGLGGGAKGRPGSRRRPQSLDSAKMARGSAGSRRRRLGEPARASAASRPHTAEALSVPRRRPSAGGPTHSPQPPPPLGRGRSQREERPRAGRPAGRGPQGLEASEVRGCLALSAREGRRQAGPLLSP